MKKQLFLTVVLCLMLQVTSFGQSIKLNNQNDPGSAILEVNSSTKGILIPNVALTGITDAITIALPAVSLLVYNTATVSDVEPGYYYNSGTAGSPFWTRLSTSTSPGTAGDGSETKVTAGTNVTVTGSGTSASPYVVNTTEVDGDVTNELQNLTEVLTKSNDAGNLTITNLANPIAATDAATKAYVDLLESKLEALEGVKDIDNNRYDIITIGTQTWMSENLKTTKYSDGTVIPLITDGIAWGDSSTNGAPGYCWYNAPNESTNLIAYGALYNWYAIDPLSNGNKNVCPTGWHVPTDGEWDILRDHLDPAANGNTNIAGVKMKEAGLAHWFTPNTGATNESGFAGLPGGFRSAFFAGIFYFIGNFGYWWSSTEFNTSNAWSRNLDYNNGNVDRDNYSKGSGFSVRCLRD
jgi:uncharacterized protein (TIGR02145 family)